MVSLVSVSRGRSLPTSNVRLIALPARPPAPPLSGTDIGLLGRRAFDRDAGNLERMHARRRGDRALFRWRSIPV